MTSALGRCWPTALLQNNDLTASLSGLHSHGHPPALRLLGAHRHWRKQARLNRVTLVDLSSGVLCTFDANTALGAPHKPRQKTSPFHSGREQRHVSSMGGPRVSQGGCSSSALHSVGPSLADAEVQEVSGLNLAGAPSGPQELPPIEAEDPGGNPLGAAASVVLTGALTLLLLRTFRRRAAKVKEEPLRSSVVARLSPPPQSKVEKAKADLAAAMSAEVASPPPTPLNAFGGAVVAGLLSYLAFSLTSNIDDTFSQQSISNVYTVRQITIAVRTIISGLGWLATGVFGANALGLTLYGIQLALGLDESSKKSANMGSSEITTADEAGTSSEKEEKAKL